MKKLLVCVAAGVAIACCAGSALAAETLLYSFEGNPPPDGFFGAGATVTQDTIGATVGTHSIKYDVAAGAFFVGARTETVIPAALNNPPGVDYILFDMTIEQAYAGAFAGIGVTIFGHAPPDFGLQAEFADRVAIEGRAPGLYKDLRIDLDSATNPVTFAPNQTFNQIVGPGPGQLSTISAFQLLLNKSTDAPVTVYIDNVRAGRVPEPSTIALLGLVAVACGGFRRRNG